MKSHKVIGKMIRGWVSTYGLVHESVEKLLALEWTSTEIYDATRAEWPVECGKTEWTLSKDESEVQLDRLLGAQRAAVKRIKDGGTGGGGGNTSTPQERVMKALKKLDNSQKLAVFTALAADLGYEIG